jgi:hypothetical protein
MPRSAQSRAMPFRAASELEGIIAFHQTIG